MARYGVVADIHGNREALAAVFAALEARGVERIVCLGDMVGYNADPDECVAMVRSRCAVSIAGNHELIAIGSLDFRRCSRDTEYAARRTRRALSAASAAWLAQLPPHCRLDERVVLVHAGVRDVQQYMTTPAHIGQNAQMLRADFSGAQLCFFGHSHEQKVYAVRGEEVTELPAEGTVALDRGALHFVNPGSVDASRKRAHKAAECAILDTSAWSVEFMRAAYDCAATEAKAAAFGYRMTPLTNRLYRLRRKLFRHPAFA